MSIPLSVDRIRYRLTAPYQAQYTLQQLQLHMGRNPMHHLLAPVSILSTEFKGLLHYRPTVEIVLLLLQPS